MKKIDYLRKKGYRITAQRKHILNAITPFPKSAEVIFDELQKKKVSLDMASVYRSLELFLKWNLISAVDFGDGKKRYESLESAKHHHHLICENCKDIEDISLTVEDNLIKELSEKTPFLIKNHSLEFFGLCANCQ